MSFYDDPLIDDNAKRSEESVNAVRSLFTRKNGFISREEQPDYGVDLDVELMTAETGASSKKFAIQIKSTGEVSRTTYGEISYLTLKFKTSRLGYLARREPAYGIIILFDEQNRTCYYDFVEEVIKRLDDLDTREGWRAQQYVTILLPQKTISPEELQHIHQKFLTRHHHSHLLLQEHGHQFNIPILDLHEEKTDKKFNFEDPEQVVGFLEKFGSFLFNEHEFQTVLQLLGQVNKSRIQNSPQLIFLSAITYTQSGNVIEAEYYLRKASKNAGALSEEEKGIIAFSEIRIEFLKGNINHASFLQRFRELSAASNNLENQLTIDINLLFFELAASVNEEKFNPAILGQISGLLSKIEAADLNEEKKHFLRVYHSENQQTFAIQTFITFYGKYRIKESLKIPTPLEERLRYAMQTISLSNASTDAVGKAYQYANENERPLLKATAAHQLSKNFLSLRLALLMIPEENALPPDKEKLVEMYARYHNLSLIGYNIFLEMHMFKNAHEALSNAYDIQKLCLKLTDKLIGTLSPERLLQIIREIEAANDLQPFITAVDALGALAGKGKKDDKTRLIEADDDTLNYMAKGLLEAYGLPGERLPNIIHGLQMTKTFYERCKNPNIE